MKKLIFILVCLSLCLPSAWAEQAAPDYADLIVGMVTAYQQPSEEAEGRLDAIADQLGGVARRIVSHWKTVWLDPGYKLYLDGTDDPAGLPVTGRHAFVVLGYQLKDGEMTWELRGRCDAAAAAAQAFPDSILVCSGGATGENNPDGHTEAGLMKAYLAERRGIDPARIFIDERAMTTEGNALNTMAILQAQGVETITIVTSTYHQRRAGTLYNAVAALYERDQGYSVRIVGNYCFPVAADQGTQMMELPITVSQLTSILRLPQDQTDRIRSQLGGPTR